MTELNVRYYAILKEAKELSGEVLDLQIDDRELDEIDEIRKAVIEVSNEPPKFITTT